MSDISKLVEEHKHIIESCSSVSGDPNVVISKAYSFIKQISKMYYKGNKMSKHYNTLVTSLESLESKCFGKEKIVNLSIPLNIFKQPTDFLDYIVWNVRKHIIDIPIDGENIYLRDLNNLCAVATSGVIQICKNHGVKCRRVIIFPGYDQKNQINNELLQHHFCIVEFDSKRYLVDITYSQFFEKRNNNLDRLGVVNLDGTNVGSYMFLTEKGREIALKILKDGYIEMTEEVFKIYMDAFTLSFRNGLFYEKNETGFYVPYTVDKYMEFLSGLDSQIKHEKAKYLGKQEKPLSDPKFEFKKLVK